MIQSTAAVAVVAVIRRFCAQQKQRSVDETDTKQENRNTRTVLHRKGRTRNDGNMRVAAAVATTR